MNHHQVIRLLEKYNSGLCSSAEQQRIEQWLDEQQLPENSWAGFDEATRRQSLLKVRSRLKHSIGQKKKHQLWKKLLQSAAILVLLTGAVFFYYKAKHNAPDPLKQNLAQNDVKPGGKKAYLTLSNGKRIALSDAANGQLATESGAQITKTKQGEIIYTGLQPTKPGSPQYNTIETPKGGTYQLRLPDGTKVWLNAASMLRYQVSFAASANRVVELSGEAYFEVAKDKQHPFKVNSAGQQVEVLGTHFNINTYPDNKSPKTTLLEGAVKVKAFGGQKVLQPGEEASLYSGNIHIEKADLQQALDWKNGDFMFRKESLLHLMQRVARWYDIDVVYAKDLDTGQTFSGQVSRTKNLSEVLKSLALSGQLKYQVQGRTVTLYP
jgi:ferric-dicitrate binding protein FerR (iron transport regulator)